MSGMTGSIRYMAPEVFLGMPYKDTCDVYSFSLLLWEMLTLEKPYDDMGTIENVTRRVFQRHARPPVARKWPAPLRRLLAKGWAPTATNRADMACIVRALQKMTDQRGDSNRFDTVTASASSMARRQALAETPPPRPAMVRRYSSRVFTFSRETSPILRVLSGLRKELMRQPQQESLTSVMEDQVE